jgi:hypothetical protein
MSGAVEDETTPPDLIGGYKTSARAERQEEPDRQSAATLLTKDAARPIAANMAKVPQLSAKAVIA